MYSTPPYPSAKYIRNGHLVYQPPSPSHETAAPTPKAKQGNQIPPPPVDPSIPRALFSWKRVHARIANEHLQIGDLIPDHLRDEDQVFAHWDRQTPSQIGYQDCLVCRHILAYPLLS